MSRQLRQVAAIGRAAVNWVRRDLPEIVAPASLPNPPGFVPPPRKTLADCVALFRHACRRYAETWDAEKMRAERAAREGQHSAQQAQRHEAEGPTLVEEFAAAAKGGSHALKPFLSNVYASRAVAYKNAVQQFVEGYKQGFKQAMTPEVPPEVASQMEAAQAQDATAAAEGEAAQRQQQPEAASPAEPSSDSSGSSAAASASAEVEGDLHPAQAAASGAADPTSRATSTQQPPEVHQGGKQQERPPDPPARQQGQRDI
ncbi:hypothetical protein ACK3TF_006011 [Chlorella vulgaris]